MESLLQDLRFGARILWRSPGMTLAVIVALALGIGANSAMFSVVDALILHPLRYHDPATLMVIRERDTQGAIWHGSDANFLDWRKAKSFSDIAAWAPASFVRTGIDLPEPITGGAVTSNFFRTLGVKPVLGRTFLDGEDGVDNPANAARVVVITYRFWQENMGADPNVLGQTLRLNSTSYAIIGVMPVDFQFVGRQHQVWVPISLNRQNRDFHRLGLVVGRLTASKQQASAEMAAMARALGDAYPKTNKGWAFEVLDFQEWLINGTFRTRLLLLFASVGMVLLIACTNVASLMMARSASRYREIAVRISVGATTARLTRQLLTESVLLSLIGGALGLMLAWRLIAAAPTFVPPNTIPAAAPIELSNVVMFFTLAISVGTGLLFGIAPALAATHPDVHETLKDSSRGSTGGRSRQLFRQSMVAAEVAVALMLLASAGLMIESLRNLTHSDLGFDPSNVLTMRLFLPAAKYDAPHELAFHQEAMRRIAALPGVKSVAVATTLPLQRPTMGAPFDLLSSPPRDDGDWPEVAYATISADYLRSLGIRVKRGRSFTEADNEASPPVVIVNEAFAQRYFPNQDPVGKRILLERPKLPTGFEDAIRPEIVGVAGNVKLTDLTAPPEPVLYAPHSQNIWATTVYFAMRASTNPAGLTAAIRRELTAMDKEQPPGQVGTIEQTLAIRSAGIRFQTQLMDVFAGLALLLAVVGIYGVSAYAVVQRRHEIGLRMALGASQGMVLREVIGQGLRLTLIGIVAGLIGAVAISSLLKSLLVGVSATDPLTLLGVSVLLALVSGVACYIPARRATRIDPAVALRQD